MKPYDLPSHVLPLPAGDRRSAVLFTGTQLRHLRLGYRIQQDFPGLLKGWWAVEPPSVAPAGASAAGAGPLRQAVSLLVRGRFLALGRTIAARVLGRTPPRLAWRPEQSRPAVEAAMFAEEVKRLRSDAAIHPQKIASADGADLLEQVRAAAPYCLLKFGGPQLSDALLACAPLAMEVYHGWLPDFAGPLACDRALYHRRVDKVGSTITLLAHQGMPQAILRRSAAALHADDTPDHCFFAAAALGSEMMVDVLAEVLEAQSLTAYGQPQEGGSVTSKAFPREKKFGVSRDFADGFLREALAVEEQW